MKKLAVCLWLLLASTSLYARSQSDSLAYQIQRKKINAMLEVRRQKFGQYDQSLSMHTGIFGLQTKKDIRRSNDILMDIAKTDNDIFQQLKILLDFRAFQQTQVQTRASEVEGNSLAYMTTINKLRTQLEKVKKEAEQDRSAMEKRQTLLFMIIVLLFLSNLFFMRRKRAAKA